MPPRMSAPSKSREGTFLQRPWSVHDPTVITQNEEDAVSKGKEIPKKPETGRSLGTMTSTNQEGAQSRLWHSEAQPGARRWNPNDPPLQQRRVDVRVPNLIFLFGRGYN